MSVETEVKIKAAAADDVRRLLENIGFVQEHDRSFEANTLYDTPDLSLLAKRQLLRLREFRGEAILTYKGPPIPGPHKSRPEYETAASNIEALRQIIQALGYEPCFRYEKYRTSFTRPGEHGHAVLDETPIGVYLELEGEPAWIDATAAQLGFAPQDYITLSYGALWRQHCQKAVTGSADMVFDSKP